jgi:hypothetical protein
MYSLDDAFNELLIRIRDPESLNPAKSDPIFYFAYPANFMLDLKQRLPRWIARIKETGFDTKRVSLSEILWRLIDESGRWTDWIELEHSLDLNRLDDVKVLNDAIRDVLRRGDAFVDAVSKEIHCPENTMVLLTEAELLHPYFRTRIIESCLHDRVKTPMVIFYPGRRSGQYGLHFLEFYPVDGNYRSTIIGGL